jgi:hypothetical protein
MGRFLADAPDAVLIAPYAYLAPLLAEPSSPRLAGALHRSLRAVAEEDGLVVVSLFGAEYSGRILGMKVPALMVAVKMRDATNALRVATSTVDELNAQFGWGLISRRVEAGKAVAPHQNQPFTERSLIVLDSSRPGIYGSLKTEEKPAFAAKSGWLIFCTNMGTLENLVNRESAFSNAPPQECRWEKGLALPRTAAYTWMNLGSTGQALRNAIAVYSLVLIAENTEGSAKTRKDLDQVKAWIEALMPLGECTLWLESGMPEFNLRFRFGAEQ